MSFTIKLGKNASEENRLTKQVSTILTVTGTLKEDTSILEPVIIIECDLSNVRKVNYMEIPAFGRKYFVTNIRSIRNGLVEFSGRVDVLSTYNSQIRANTGIIKRQEKNWNLYLNDGVLKVYQNPKVQTKNFPSGFSTIEFVLAVAGR